MKKGLKKMSTMKKIGALIMALAMCFALAMPAFAEGETTGSITIDNAVNTYTDDNNESHAITYTPYKIFDAQPFGSSDDQSNPSAATPGKVVYTATEKQMEYWTNKNGGEVPTLFDFAKSGSSYVVTLHSGVTSKEIAEYFNKLNESQETLKKLVTDQILTKCAALTYDENDKQATGSGLEFGYYFISSGVGTVVSIDTTNPDVVVEDKNTYNGDPFKPHDGELKKIKQVNNEDVSGNVSVNIGDTVTYEVSVDTTNYVTVEENGKKNSEKVTYVYIDDTLEEAVDYNEGSFTLTVNDGTDHTLDKKDSSFATQDGTLSYNVSFKNADANGNKSFHVVIPWCDDKGNPAFKDGATVTLTYSGTVNNKIKVAEGTNPSDNADNAASVSYKSTGNNQDIPTDPDTGTDVHKEVVTGKTSVYSYALAIKKTDVAAAAPLSGAKFEVKKGNETLKFNKDNTTGEYFYDATNGTTTVESDTNGMIIMKGVAAGNYTVTETEAPTGYNAMAGSKDFTAIEAGVTNITNTITTTTYKFEEAANGEYVKDEATGHFSKATGTEADGTKKYKLVEQTSETATGADVGTIDYDMGTLYSMAMDIPNGTGTELPSTGGIGTTIFYVVGGAMVIGAGVLLIVKKRMVE